MGNVSYVSFPPRSSPSHNAAMLIHLRATENSDRRTGDAFVNRSGPKVKLARQLGIALTPKAARVMERRPNPPGQHGASPRRKVSGS